MAITGDIPLKIQLFEIDCSETVSHLAAPRLAAQSPTGEQKDYTRWAD